MGMVLGLCEISERTRRRILEDPPLVWQLVARDAPEVYHEARARASRPGFFGRLFGKSAVPVNVPPLELDPFEGADMDVDKAWHGIHFLLTGTSEGGAMPEAFLMLGGDYVGEEDLGYGPVRALSATDVAAIHAMLDSLSDDALSSRFDAARMEQLEIYPNHWSSDIDDEGDLSVPYLMENVTSLRAAIAGAASRGHGVLISIS